MYIGLRDSNGEIQEEAIFRPVKKVLLLSTGGTISSTKRDDGTAVPTLTGKDLMKTLPGIESVATVDAYEVSRVPGHYLGFKEMIALSRRIEDSLRVREYSGVVVTMGTNIIEEAAYCLDLMLRIEDPVVITGA